jgi:hypothetical protein
LVACRQDGGDLLKIVVEGFDWLGLGFRPQKRCSPAGEPWGTIASDAGGAERPNLSRKDCVARRGAGVETGFRHPQRSPPFGRSAVW